MTIVDGSGDDGKGEGDTLTASAIFIGSMCSVNEEDDRHENSIGTSGRYYLVSLVILVGRVDLAHQETQHQMGDGRKGHPS